MLPSQQHLMSDNQNQNQNFIKIRSSHNSRLKHEQNLCTHCVTLFLVPLLVVARDADIGETELLLHLRSCRHSKAQGQKEKGSPQDRTSSIPLALPHAGSLLRGRKENRPLCYSGTETGVLLLYKFLSATVMLPTPDRIKIHPSTGFFSTAL